jgi:hypothetical protein
VLARETYFSRQGLQFKHPSSASNSVSQQSTEKGLEDRLQNAKLFCKV